MNDHPILVIATSDPSRGREAALRWAASQMKSGRPVVYLAIEPTPNEVLCLWRKMFPQTDPPQIVDAESVRLRSERDLQAWINLPIAYVVDSLNRAVPTLWEGLDSSRRSQKAYARFLDLLIARVRRSGFRIALILFCKPKQDVFPILIPGNPLDPTNPYRPFIAIRLL